MSEDNANVPLKITPSALVNAYKEVRIDFQENKDSEKIRLTFPIYDDQEEMEILLKLLREFFHALVRHEWWETAGETKVYRYFERCLVGNAVDMWINIVVTKDQDTWSGNICDLVERLIGKEAYEAQLDYLKETKKPRSRTMRKRLMRIKSINTYFQLLENGGEGESSSERDLVKLITKNLPRSWQSQFKIAGGHKSRTVIKAQHLLLLIEQQETKSIKKKESGGNVQGKKDKKGGKNKS